MKSERVVSNPENHGWEEVNGKWIWASGRNTGHITDGDTEGQITTWHDASNAWTPSNYVIVDSGTGNATFANTLSAARLEITSSAHISELKSTGLFLGRDSINYISATDPTSIIRFDTGGSETLRLTNSGDATFSGKVTATVRLEANTITSVAKSGRAGFLFANNARILPCDDNGTLSNGVSDLGRPDGRYQYLYLSESVISTRHGVSLGTRDLIETLATLRASTLDETVDVRQALASACDKLIEKFESMQEVATRFEQADNEEEM